MFSQIGFHNSTVGHFPILAALYLILRPNQDKRVLWWSILLPCTLMIHPYTFAMLVAMWLADLLDELVIQKKLSALQVIFEVFCAITATVLLAWQAGYFMNVSPGETGFGMYRMNLLALFDPSGFDARNWSFLFSLPWVRSNNNYEGFVYLGLGLIPGKVTLLKGGGLRVPHVGWNTLNIDKAHPIFQNIKSGRDFYFVHSYAVVCDHESDLLASTDYGGLVTAVVGRANVVGVQFHPEAYLTEHGKKMMQNWLEHEK
jgi:hypothetical protein